MREFGYCKLAERSWPSDILNFVAKIHECKGGRQDIYVRQKPVALDRLVEIARIQSAEASNNRQVHGSGSDCQLPHHWQILRAGRIETAGRRGFDRSERRWEKHFESHRPEKPCMERAAFRGRFIILT